MKGSVLVVENTYQIEEPDHLSDLPCAVCIDTNDPASFLIREKYITGDFYASSFTPLSFFFFAPDYSLLNASTIRLV